MSNYRDYLWTKSSGGFDDYCLTLIGTSTPDEVLAELGAHRERIVARGMNDALFEGYDLGEDHNVNGVERQIAAVADIGGGWTLMIQMPGFIGISDVSLARVVVGHETVSHSQNVNACGRFEWWSEGVRQISFEPLLPYWDLLGGLADRQPTDSRNRIIDLIRDVGGIDLEETPGREFNDVPGSFALAERLTGVRITPELLSESTFTVAVVPLDAATDHDHALDDPIVPLLDEPPTWSQMVRLHRASAKQSLHGAMRRKAAAADKPDLTLEFWRKPRGSAWRTDDADGVCLVQNNRRGDWWWMKNGVEIDQPEGGFSNSLRASWLIEIGGNLWTGDFASATSDDAVGEPVQVAGRPAWEFELTDDNHSISRAAFDAETGVTLRRASPGQTYELVEVEIGIPLADSLFEGP